MLWELQLMKPNKQSNMNIHQLRFLLSIFGHDTPKLLENLFHNICCLEKRSVLKSHRARCRLPLVSDAANAAVFNSRF